MRENYKQFAEMIENRTALPSSNYFNFTLLLDDIMGPGPALSPRGPPAFDFKTGAFSDASTDAGSERSNRGSLISSPAKSEESQLLRGVLGRDRLVNEFECGEREETEEEPVKTRFSLSECFRVGGSRRREVPRLRVSGSGLGVRRPRVFGGAQLKGCLKGRHFQRLARKLKRAFEKGRLVSS